MSSMILERYQARHPTERDAISRLQALLKDGKTYRLTLDQLADKLDANSRDELALILGELSAAGLVDFELQVTSPSTNQPLKGYKSLGEIPAVLHDATTDSDFQVNLENVRPIYSIRSHAHESSRG